MGLALPLTSEQKLIKRFRSLFDSRVSSDTNQIEPGFDFDQFVSSISENDPFVKQQFDVIFQECYRRRKASVTLPSRISSESGSLTNVLQNFRRRHSTIAESNSRSVSRAHHSSITQLPRSESQVSAPPSFFSPHIGSSVYQPPFVNGTTDDSVEHMYINTIASSYQPVTEAFIDHNGSLAAHPFSPFTLEPITSDSFSETIQNNVRFSNRSVSNAGLSPTSRNEHHPRNIRQNQIPAFYHSALHRSNPYINNTRRILEGRLRRNSEMISSATYNGPPPTDFLNLSSVPSTSRLSARNSFYPFDPHQ